MPTTGTVERRELADEVESLYATYCEALDDGEIERWPGFFAAEGRYRITTKENVERGMPLCFVLCDGQAMLRDRAAALRKTVVHRRRVQRRILSGLRLKTIDGPDGGAIQTCVSFLLCESMGDGPTRLLVSGRASDAIVREAGALRFQQRLCVIDARIVPDSLVFPI